MSNNSAVMDRRDGTGPALGAGGASLYEVWHHLSAVVELHDVRVIMLADTCLWDVQKRRTVTVAQLVGRHPFNSQPLQGCSECKTIERALRSLASCALPPQGDCCQHATGATRARQIKDDLSEMAHQVALPIILIHRTASRTDESAVKCVAEFRAYLQCFGVRELNYAETSDRCRE